MTELQIVMAMICGLATLMLALWKSTNSSMEKRFDKVDERFNKVDQRFDKLEEKVTDIDRRLCRLEGAFSKQECCMLKDHRKASSE